MDTLNVELGLRSYPILIGQGLLRDREILCRHIGARDVLVVSNTTVAPLYLHVLENSLQPRKALTTLLPDGE